MKKSTHRLGNYDLAGSAIDRVRSLPDDNHADPADEAQALENFRSFSASFLKTQLRFLDDAKLSD